MFDRLVNFVKSTLCLILRGLGLRNSSDEIIVDIVYKSDDYIIVNKPEDVFINNHNKEVSLPVDVNILCVPGIGSIVK